MVPDYLIDLFTKTNVVHGYGTRQAEFRQASKAKYKFW